jgi:hypothetical protein
LVNDGPAYGADELENAPGHCWREGEGFLGPFFVVVIIAGELERLVCHATRDVGPRGIMECDSTDIALKGYFLDGKAELGEVGVGWELCHAGDAFSISVDEPSLATFGVERAQASHAETLKANYARNALAGLDDKTGR